MQINLIFYAINIILTFISRSIFIRILGANINGLNSLFMSLIGFLNVAELGVGAAVGYSLYKPLNEKNSDKIKDIMFLFRYYYKNIAKIISVLGIVLSIFLPYLIKGQVNVKLAYIYYFMYLFNCAISYLFTYKQTLIIADQKQYKIAYELNITKILKIIIQCIIIYITKNYLIWILLEIGFNILGMYIANKKIDFEYEGILNENNSKNIRTLKTENSEIGSNIRNIFFHKIGTFVVKQTDAIVISLFSTLIETGIYANYIIIINAITGLLSTSIGSVMPSIGNLIAEESKEKSYKIFRQLYLLDHLIALFFSICTYFMINQFIIWWIGEQYLFTRYCVLALIFNMYIEISRGTIDRFKSGFGIFWDVWAPLVESGVNLIISVILAWKVGIIGVFIGTIISNIIIVEVWKPYILFKEGFNISIYNYIEQTIKIYVKNIIVIIICNLLYDKLTNYIHTNNLFLSLIVNGLIISGICVCSMGIVYGFTNEFRELVLIIKNKMNFRFRK